MSSFCLHCVCVRAGASRSRPSNLYLLIISPIFPQMWLRAVTGARFRKMKLTLLILPLSSGDTICAADLNAPPETFAIIHTGMIFFLSLSPHIHILGDGRWDNQLGYRHSSCPHTPTYVKGRTSTQYVFSLSCCMWLYIWSVKGMAQHILIVSYSHNFTNFHRNMSATWSLGLWRSNIVLCLPERGECDASQLKLTHPCYDVSHI